MKKKINKNVLVIDIGNSYSKIAIAKNSLVYKKTIIKNEKKLDFKKIRLIIEKYKNVYFHGVIIGSVVPKLTKIFCEAVKEIIGIQPYLINKKTKLNFQLPKLSINKIGQDILALCQYSVNKNENAISFCFGTAIFAILIKNKNLIGVSISIGLMKNLESLNLNAELINKIKVKKVKKNNWGITTRTALESGLYHYAVGFMNSFYKTAKNYLKTDKIYSVISGGETVNLETNFNYELNYDAVLLGYNLIYWMNQDKN